MPALDVGLPPLTNLVGNGKLTVTFVAAVPPVGAGGGAAPRRRAAARIDPVVRAPSPTRRAARDVEGTQLFSYGRIRGEFSGTPGGDPGGRS